MNKTLGTIGAATLLLGSLTIVQARDTITRQEFEKAAHILEKGVEDGTISREAARAGIEELRSSVGEEEKPAGRGRLERAGMEIRKAVAEGRITEQQGREKMEALRRKMAGEPEREARRGGERQPREAYARAEAELKQAVKAGKISEEDAKARLDGLRRRLAAEGERRDQPKDGAESADRPREDAAQDTAEGIGKRLKQVGERLKEAVANGDMTADEAWAKWNEVKEQQVGPRLAEAVKDGRMSEQDAKAVWRAIARAELGEKLKAAVAAGEMSEQDARAKWEAFDKEDAEPGKN